jgi:predicted metalloprotease with PDZ domain
MSASRQRLRLEIADQAARHFLVRQRVTGIVSDSIEAFMPIWAPGSYTQRDYAGYVVDVAVTGPGSPAIEKVESSRWSITGCDGEVELEYRVFAPELGVRSNDITDQHAFVHPPATFLGIEGLLNHPVELEIVTPDGWRVFTAMKEQGGVYQAENYDRLMDCPIELGDHEEREFTVAGKRHRFVFNGEGNYDIDRVIEDTKKIVQYEIDLFGGEAPYDDYLFILHLTGGAGGGLEHMDSCVCGWPRMDFRPEKEYRKFLTLIAHEFFHVWNVKRIRPDVLLDYDYMTPAYSRLLWVFEGWTTYYDEIICCRAGTSGPKELLAALAEHVQTEASRPGGTVQSLEDSSFDAWVKLYRANPDTQNTQTNYYLKGLLVGWLLDLRLRAESRGTKSLDDVMLHLWKEVHPAGRGLAEGGAAALIQEATGVDVTGFLSTHVESAGTLDYTAALDTLGLEMKRKPDDEVDGAQAWLGAALTVTDGLTKLAVVYHDSPAHEAGLMAGDEVVAIGGLKTGRDLGKRIEAYKPGDATSWHAFRDGRLVGGEITFGRDPVGKLEIKPKKDASDAQKQAFEAWAHAKFDELTKK